ncbi:hypothetical protein [Nocardioides panaciterrulae]|uniref:Lipoprotein n=1 Tax=Nocardioides panaciterrulae TaxID=661492 RepID=A0A7Y9E8B0_9ACTN|nr:hypothetical protein [Nocardioides panaciterrulae]NYD42706.1 hypothetical protein [Nocardioides panaciterrulae]
MRLLTRTMLTVSALGLAVTASACSSDDSTSDASASAAEPSAAATTEARTSCRVQVALTGDVQATWKGKGFATTENTSGPPAFYQAAGKGFTLSMYAEGNGFDHASAVVTADKVTYTTQPGSGHVQVDDSGKGGQVDADATGIKPHTQVHVKASFDC